MQINLRGNTDPPQEPAKPVAKQLMEVLGG
jgi:hypothetical protein